jgi:endonuclease YncB( thermonuclease family)
VARSRSSLRFAAALFAAWVAASGSADPKQKSTPSSDLAHSVHIRDGDSLIVRDGERQRELRIAEIDAPERGQTWGKRAMQALAGLVEGEELRVELVEIDRYGREVSRVFVGDTCVACELVRGGHAWAYREHLRDPRLLELEAGARAARRGLWSQPAHTFVPPWEWRRGARRVGPEAALALLGSEPEAPGAAPACGRKRYCKEMTSCAEARFYLEHCNIARLDGDGDGVACEDLCF